MESKSNSVRTVIKYELTKVLINDDIYTSNCVALINKFLFWCKRFISYAYHEFVSVEDLPELVEKYRKLMDSFIMYDLPILKCNTNYQLNYIITYKKMIETACYQDDETENITLMSIKKALDDHPDIDYHILIASSIPFTSIWMICEDKAKLIKCMDQMYKIASILWEKHIVERDYDIFFNDQNIPCTIYKSKMHGQAETIQTLINASIFKNEDIEDPIYRKKVIETGGEILDNVLDVFYERGVDVDDFNVQDQGISANLAMGTEDLYMDLKNKIESGGFDTNALTDIGVSLIRQYKQDPDGASSNTELRNYAYMVIEYMREAKKMGAKVTKHAEKICRVLKETFGPTDDDVPIDIRRAVMQQKRQMKGMVQYRMK